MDNVLRKKHEKLKETVPLLAGPDIAGIQSWTSCGPTVGRVCCVLVRPEAFQ